MMMISKVMKWYHVIIAYIIVHRCIGTVYYCRHITVAYKRNIRGYYKPIFKTILIQTIIYLGICAVCTRKKINLSVVWLTVVFLPVVPLFLRFICS